MASTTQSTTFWKDQSVVPSNLTVLGQWAPTRAFRAVYGAENDPVDLPAPNTGDVALVMSPGAGAWVGRGNQLAEWDGTAWTFTSPVQGLVIGVPLTWGFPLLVWTGTEWQPLWNYLDVAGMDYTSAADYYLQLASAGDSRNIVVCIATGNDINVHLPAATERRDLRFHFITPAGRQVNIIPAVGDTINGDGTQIFDHAHNGEHRHVVCYNTGKWACG